MNVVFCCHLYLYLHSLTEPVVRDGDGEPFWFGSSYYVVSILFDIDGVFTLSNDRNKSCPTTINETPSSSISGIPVIFSPVGSKFEFEEGLISVSSPINIKFDDVFLPCAKSFVRGSLGFYYISSYTTTITTLYNRIRWCFYAKCMSKHVLSCIAPSND